MKTIVATAALVVALASPVMAQEYMSQQSMAQEYQAPGSSVRGGPVLQSWQDPGQAYAQSDGVILRPRSPNPAFDVYRTTGEYLGSDPDPLVRSQLQFDPPGSGD